MFLPKGTYRETFDVFQYYDQAWQCYNRIRSNGGNAEIIEELYTDPGGDRLITYRVDRFEENDYGIVNCWDDVVIDDWENYQFDESAELYEDYREHQPRVAIESSGVLKKPSNVRKGKERKLFILD